MTTQENLRAALATTALVAALLMAGPVRAEISIQSLTGIIDGHEVGGVSIDMVGNVYAADFGDVVWKITPEGVRTEFAAGMYGTAGNAIDNQGFLLQSSFYGDVITRIDRKGRAEPFVTRGLSRPTGIAVLRQTGEAYVANCQANSIARIEAGGNAVLFARSDLFNCPYSLTFDREGNLYTVNFRDPRMLKIDAKARSRCSPRSRTRAWAICVSRTIASTSPRSGRTKSTK